MSIVGIFTRAQPSIEGYGFDAVLSESSELVTEVTKFPIETGAIGNDHAVINPLKITMTVGVSDNFFQQAKTIAGGAAALASIGAGTVTGKIIGASGDLASKIGLVASIANAAFAAGSSFTRSQTVLEAIREFQRTKAIVNVIGSKRQYQNCIITRTAENITKENEQGLELVVDLQQLLIVNSEIKKNEIPAQNDTAELQAQEITNIGQVTLQ